MPSLSYPLLRRTLAADALTCFAAGGLMALAAAPLAPLTGLPVELLRGAGVSLFPVAALFAWMSRTERLSAPLGWLAVGGNAVWIAASLLVLLIVPTTTFGTAFVLGQAAAVAALTVLEYAGLRGRTAATAAP
jgi:hypothetical protein